MEGTVVFCVMASGVYIWRGLYMEALILEFYGNTWILLTYANSFYSLTNSK